MNYNIRLFTQVLLRLQLTPESLDRVKNVHVLVILMHKIWSVAHLFVFYGHPGQFKELDQYAPKSHPLT